ADAGHAAQPRLRGAHDEPYLFRYEVHRRSREIDRGHAQHDQRNACGVDREAITMKNANGFAQTYFSKLKTVVDKLDSSSVDAACDLVYEAWQSGRQVITLGNGGSAMTALHFINDWNKSVFLKSGKPFYGRSLVDNLALVLAYGNDISFQDIFVEQ